MKLSEKFAAIRETLELFPLCIRCGGRLDPNRLRDLVAVDGRPNRFAHAQCPTGSQ